MNNARRSTTSNGEQDRRFPREAYDFHDDVTKDAVDKMRTKAAPAIESEEWETVDGFGRVLQA